MKKYIFLILILYAALQGVYAEEDTQSFNIGISPDPVLPTPLSPDPVPPITDPVLHIPLPPMTDSVLPAPLPPMTDLVLPIPLPPDPAPLDPTPPLHIKIDSISILGKIHIR